MDLMKKIRNWWHGFFRKRRFNMLKATDLSEEWHIHISPASILAGLVAFLLTLFIIILSLVAYTPVLELLPGYRTEADRSRESLIQNIIRLDSMERVMNDMMTYNENIALIMEGRTPVAPGPRSGRFVAHLQGPRRTLARRLPAPGADGGVAVSMRWRSRMPGRAKNSASPSN